MPEIARATPGAISDLTGTWALDPRRTTIQFQTKAMWVLNVNGTLRATEGSGAVDGNGQVTGRLVVDANSSARRTKGAAGLRLQRSLGRGPQGGTHSRAVQVAAGPAPV